MIRQALSVGLGTFAGRQWRALPFAAARVEAITKSLSRFGYSCSTLDDAAGLTAETLAEAIWRAASALTPDDALLVHILSHGHISEKTDALYVVGADGQFAPGNAVNNWMERVADSPGLPHMLFLLDICHAGRAARPRWHIDDAKRGWVIAACAPGESAFNGRFTEAVANVLDLFARNDVEFDPSRRNIPLETFARAVRREVKRLIELGNGYPQVVTGSLLDITADLPDLPFFPNRHPATDPLALARPQVDAAVAPFLDEVDEALDAAHFIERAGGHGELPSRQQGAGCFSGRRRELRLLSEWVDGYDNGRLMVVTGSPGVGKSALVGVAVCAAHPKLREPTNRLWARLDRTPYRNNRLVAVHARQRDLDELEASIRRQLSLEPQGDLLAQLRTLDEPPVIIIDALDEAERYEEVMRRLLLPLATSDPPACRLLIAMRPWSQLRPLRELAEAAGGLIDLDTVPAEVLRHDLEDYIRELLRYQAPYSELPYAGARETFALAVAAELTRPRGGDEQRWGAFLVAGLYTYHLLTAHEPIRDPQRASELGSQVPLTLPALLEMELAARRNVPWLRPLLTAFAHARGDGMPLQTASHVAQAFAPLDQPGQSEIAPAMRIARFYLRRSADVDGTTLYRLFHQGLSDYLRDDNQIPYLLAAMLAPIEVAGSRARRWDLAEPYLRRHAVQHCTDPSIFADDPEFFVYADPAAITALLATDSPVSWLDAESHQRLGTQIVERRYGLARLALRAGEHKIAHSLTESLPYRPLWTVMAPGTSPAICVGEGPTGAAFMRSADLAYVFTWGPGADFRTWVVGQERGSLLWAVKLARPVARVETGPGVVLVVDDEGGLRAMELTTGAIAPLLVPGGTTLASTLDATRAQWLSTEQGRILVEADEVSGIRLFKQSRVPHGLIPTDGRVSALDCVSDTGTLIVAALCGDQVVVYKWLLRRHALGDVNVLGRAAGQERIACVKLGARIVVITSGQQVLVWRWPTTWASLTGRRITRVACDPHGQYAATAAADGTVVVRHASDGTPMGELRSMRTSALAFTTLRHRRVLLVGTHAGDAGVWDIERGAWVAFHPATPGESVKAVATAELGSGAMLLAQCDTGVRVMDLATGAWPKGSVLASPEQEAAAAHPVPLGLPVDAVASSANGDLLVLIEGEALYLKRM